MKKFLALVLAAMLAALPVISLAEEAAEPTEEPVLAELTGEAGKYIYKDAVSQMASNWNPHTYQTTDDAYPADFLRVGLYGFVFNDELHPVEGREAFESYKIIPEMAASEPVDVTEQVKAEHPEFNIPESATKGFAYTIDLNEKAVWEDGTPINADTYVYSMQRLLDPKLKNYRATDYYAQDLCVAGAKEYANAGSSAYDGALDMSVADYVAKGGKVEDLYVDINGFWGITTADGKTYASVTDETLIRDPAVPKGENEDFVSAKYLYENYLADGAPYEGYQSEYLGTATSYPDGVDFSTVGLYKTGDYQITLVLSKSLSGFYLLYNLSSNWIVKEDLYEANLKETGDTFTSTYCTDVATTSSYGPYKLVNFEKDKNMHFVKNENWYGWTDGNHTYVDPVDGETYAMYMSDEVDTQVVAEAATRKLMFLKGLLMGYGLQSDDFATYRNSEWCHVTPDETIYFFIFNGYMSKLKEREASEGFDTTKYDLETMSLTSFRKAVAVSYDRELFASTVSPSRSGGYGLIGTNYIYDPESGARYRDTDQAKKALCDFYSVDVSAYASLDEAAASITGYDPVAAKELYKQAFDDALAAGFITDEDGDGKCDQMIRIEYCSSVSSAFITKTLAYLNEKMADVTKDTPFEGKIEFYESAPYGNDWSNKIKEGLSDTVLGGWGGSALNPFSLSNLYVDPGYAYDAKWFDPTQVSMTMTVKVGDEEKELTTNVRNWSDMLNGTTLEIDGVEYNFGADQADVETRLDILGAFETAILNTYDYVPMLQNGSMALLSQQVFYVVEEYNPIMGRGGIAYLKYNYDEAEWADFVKSQPDGTLSY